MLSLAFLAFLVTAGAILIESEGLQETRLVEVSSLGQFCG